MMRSKLLPAIVSDTFFDTVFRDIDKDFNKFLTGISYPVYDLVKVLDDNDEVESYVFRFALGGSGLTKDDLSVKIDKGKLVITGKSNKKENNKEVVLHNGIAKRDFSITFNLFENVNCDNVTTKYVDGVLEINLPLDKVSPKIIDIQVS